MSKREQDITTTAWYYDYYETGTFPHQQALCKAVEWTTCNLEGHKLVPTTLFTEDGKEIPTVKLTEMPANPLTIRLLALSEALEHLEDELQKVNKPLQKEVKEAFSKGDMVGIGGTLETHDSSAETGGAPIDRITLPSGKIVEFKYVKIHLALYQFFSNLGSVLDRIAYEIDMLFSLRIQKVDWPKLTKIPKARTNEHLETLRSKCPDLASTIEADAQKLEHALKYRNRLIHDGIIRVGTEMDNLQWTVLLAQSPDDDNSPLDVNAISFCKKTKEEVLTMLDESYKLILGYLHQNGNPPW